MAVYFELYGLPGAGKTTLCRPVINFLEDNGYKVADLDCIYHRNCRNGNKIPVFLKLLLKVRLYPLYFKLLKVYLSCNSSDRSFSFFLKSVFLSYQILDANKKGKYDIILCEEGFVQYISSFSYAEKLPNTESIKELCSYIHSLIEVHLIQCLLGVEDSFKRIEGRPVVSRRYSSTCPAEQLRKALDTKSINLSVISSYFSNKLSLDMFENLNNNRQRLISYILEK